MSAELFTWGFIASLYIAAFAVLQLERHWHRTAEVFFTLATLLAVGRLVLWVWDNPDGVRGGVALTVATFAIVAAIWFVRKVEGDISKQEPDAPAFPVEKINVITERISSPDEAFPFGLRLTIQTNIPISPAEFRIECSEIIGAATAYPASGGAAGGGQNDPAGKSRVFSFRQDFPAFTPQNPILVFLSTAKRATCRVTKIR